MMMMEGGEEKQKTNVNFLLEEYGVMVNTGEREGRGGERRGGEGRGREGRKGEERKGGGEGGRGEEGGFWSLYWRGRATVMAM